MERRFSSSFYVGFSGTKKASRVRFFLRRASFLVAGTVALSSDNLCVIVTKPFILWTGHPWRTHYVRTFMLTRGLIVGAKDCCLPSVKYEKQCSRKRPLPGMQATWRVTRPSGSPQAMPANFPRASCPQVDVGSTEASHLRILASTYNESWPMKSFQILKINIDIGLHYWIRTTYHGASQNLQSILSRVHSSKKTPHR